MGRVYARGITTWAKFAGGYALAVNVLATGDEAEPRLAGSAPAHPTGMKSPCILLHTRGVRCAYTADRSAASVC